MASATTPQLTRLEEYRQEMILSLRSARDLAAASVQKAQSRYKKSNDKKSYSHEYKIGQWILIRFPQEETRAKRKLSRPWHGPHRAKAARGPNIVGSRIYFPDDGTIQVHLSRVSGCPMEFPRGFYWYGGCRAGPGRPPKWHKTVGGPIPTNHSQLSRQKTQSPWSQKPLPRSYPLMSKKSLLA